MKKMKSLIYIALVIGLLGFFPSQDLQASNKNSEKELANFPEELDGLVRHVILLQQKKNEADYKVEIIPGKQMSVDCNNHRLIGTLTEETLTGWGYSYFLFKSEGLTASTMMFCNEPKTEKFVTGNTSTIDYNSKLPIVIYAPKGFDVKYRIWKAEKIQNSLIK